MKQIGRKEARTSRDQPSGANALQANKTGACKHFSMITKSCQQPPGSDFQTEGAGSIPSPAPCSSPGIHGGSGPFSRNRSSIVLQLVKHAQCGTGNPLCVAAGVAAAQLPLR
jgi:hypothetical protein